MRELVPGDLVALKGGDVIPADCKASVACQGLFEVNPSVRRRMQVMRAQEGAAWRRSWDSRRAVHEPHLPAHCTPHPCPQLVGKGEPLKVDESSLTGESLEVTRRPGDKVRRCLG